MTSSIKLGDRVLLVQNPGKPELAAMRQWVLRQPLPHQKPLNSEELSELTEEQQKILLQAYVENRNAKRMPNEAEIVEIVDSPKGVAMMLWLASRTLQRVTLAEIQPHINDDNFGQVRADLDEALKDAETNEEPKEAA